MSALAPPPEELARELGPGALLDELARYLRPPGQGIYAVSTGREALAAKTAAYLGGAWDPASSWREALAAVVDARVGMASRVRRILQVLAPELRLFMLGGDHTVTWPVLAPLLEGCVEDLGIMHFDAHTDLLPSRLGIRYCFATWAYHANAAPGGGQRLIQLGIRASGHPREYWERELGVRQIWGAEAAELSPQALADSVVTHLRGRGIARVYISNDIDGTDARFAAACGTPELGGLHPDQVKAVIAAVGAAFEVIGADLVELAPGLSLSAELAQTSTKTAFEYAKQTLQAMEGKPGNSHG